MKKKPELCILCSICFSWIQYVCCLWTFFEQTTC